MYSMFQMSESTVSGILWCLVSNISNDNHTNFHMQYTVWNQCTYITLSCWISSMWMAWKGILFFWKTNYSWVRVLIRLAESAYSLWISLAAWSMGKWKKKKYKCILCMIYIVKYCTWRKKSIFCQWNKYCVYKDEYVYGCYLYILYVHVLHIWLALSYYDAHHSK